ncbi:MAG: hypothetical protein AAB660_02575 [Patescibacteria group bacterium]
MNALTRIIIVGVMIIAFGGGLYYELSSISNIRDDVTEANIAIQEKTGSDSRTKSILALQENYKDDLVVINDSVLNKTELVSVLEELEKTGRNLGLKTSISSITDEATKTASSTAQTVRITVNTEGVWSSNLAFVRLIENLPYKISVERADLSKAEEIWKTSAIIKVTTYPEK